MTKSFKRGYIEREKSEYVVAITKVTQNDNYGKWEDEDEDEINRFCGYDTKESAIEDLKYYFKVKEILDEDYNIIWSRQ